jgi:anti-sigma B factor antagonist
MNFSINPLSHCDLIKISGRIDSYTAPKIQDALDSLIRKGQYNILVDMQDVSYLSSSGILVFLDAHRKLQGQDNGTMILTNLPPNIFSVFEIVGLENVFNCCEDVQSAEERFQK